jgi:hypothetical protein
LYTFFFSLIYVACLTHVILLDVICLMLGKIFHCTLIWDQSMILPYLLVIRCICNTRNWIRIGVCVVALEATIQPDMLNMMGTYVWYLPPALLCTHHTLSLMIKTSFWWQESFPEMTFG